MPISISTSLETLSSPSPALPHWGTPCNGACWICLGLTSSWLSMDLWTDTSLSTFTEAGKLLVYGESNCRKSSLLWVESWRSPGRVGLHLSFGTSFPQLWASLSQVYQCNQWSGPLTAVASYLPSCSPPFVKCKFTGVLWCLITLMFAKRYYYWVLKSLRGI